MCHRMHGSGLKDTLKNGFQYNAINKQTFTVYNNQIQHTNTPSSAGVTARVLSLLPPLTSSLPPSPNLSPTAQGMSTPVQPVTFDLLALVLRSPSSRVTQPSQRYTRGTNAVTYLCDPPTPNLTMHICARSWDTANSSGKLSQLMRSSMQRMA